MDDTRMASDNMTNTTDSVEASMLSSGYQISLAILPKLSSFLSMMGSSLIAYQICVSQRHERFRKPFHRLVLGMCLCDIMASTAWFFTTWPIPSELAAYSFGASGNTHTCTAQGFFAQFSIATVMYNASLATYYTVVTGVLRVKQQQAVTTIRRLEPLLHINALSWGLGTAVASISLQLFNSTGWDCWIAAQPPGCVESWLAPPGESGTCVRGDNATLYIWVFYYAPLWVVILYATITMAYINHRIRRTEKISGLENEVLLTNGGMYSSERRVSLLGLPAPVPVANEEEEEIDNAARPPAVAFAHNHAEDKDENEDGEEKVANEEEREVIDNPTRPPAVAFVHDHAEDKDENEDGEEKEVERSNYDEEKGIADEEFDFDAAAAALGGSSEEEDEEGAVSPTPPQDNTGGTISSSASASQQRSVSVESHKVLVTIDNGTALASAPVSPPPPTERKKHSRAVAQQSLYYLGVFYITWFWPSVFQIYMSITSTTLATQNPQIVNVLNLLSAMTVPIQGFLNLIVYQRPAYLRHLKSHPTRNRIKCWFITLGHELGYFSKSTKFDLRTAVAANSAQMQNMSIGGIRGGGMTRDEFYNLRGGIPPTYEDDGSTSADQSNEHRS
jgi:hypothetical protein